MEYKAVLPIFGFDGCKRVSLEQIDDIFFRMENLDNKSLPSFTLVLPSALRDDYHFDIPEHIVQKLEIENPEDIKVLNIMILNTPIETSHVNFMAPLLFNTKIGLMGQFVIEPKDGQNFGIADKLSDYINKEEVS